jgi:hypothetical protein
LATYLDPLTYDYLNAQQLKDAEKEIYILFPNQTNQQAGISSVQSQIPNSIKILEKSSRSDEIDDFNKLCGVSISKENNSFQSLSTKEEIAKYISSKGQYTDITKYWSEHEQALPKLSSLVRKYCMIQASSVASESAFSIANYIQRKERSSLSAENLRYSIFLREMPKIEKLYQEYCLMN